MEELVVNLHMHTRYSDGSGSHADIARAALQTGLDVVIVTDHNIYVEGRDQYFREGKHRLLMLIGEEVHDQARDPQRNHLLVFGARRELATFADKPQNLIDNTRKAGGICFLAHPHDAESKPIHETGIAWEDWSVTNYNGIELWNGLSELKEVSPTLAHFVFHAYLPHLVGRSPNPLTLAKWDELLASGQRVVAIGGSDAHAWPASLGPLKGIIYPYEFHFKTINTHILTDSPLTGNLEKDSKMVYDALSSGHCFVAYDLPGSTRGFRFSAQGATARAIMGDEIELEGGVTLQAKLPQPADIHLLRDGKVIQRWRDRDIFSYIATQPGAYRVEAYRPYLGRMRGWVYSNPIYIRE